MEGIAGLFGVMIPIVAIGGAFAYAAYERWQEGEEKKHAVNSAAAGEDTQRRILQMEQDIAMLRTQVGDDLRDVKERLMRIEKLLSEVE